MKKLLVFVVLLAAGAGAAYHFGYLDRLLPGLFGARSIPKDSKLLAYFEPEAHELGLVQMTELNFPLSEQARQKLEKDGREFYEKTGINVRQDVDAVAGVDGLAVARGRFDWSKLGTYLQSEGYTLAELEGVPAAIKPHAADVALDGNYLLIGRSTELKKALARKRQGHGLENGSPVVKAIDELGWKHAMVGGFVSGSRLSSEAPSNFEVHAVVGAIDSAPEGFHLRTVAFTGSKEQAATAQAWLEALRKTALLQMAATDKPEVRTLRDSLERATLEADPQGRLRGAIVFPYALMDQASTDLSQSQLPSAFQSMQLADEGEEAQTTTAPAALAPQPTKDSTATAPATVATVSHSLDWKPPVFGLVLLVVALLTMGAQSRPGLFNVLLHPLFLLPFLVATLGVFVLRWTRYSGGMFELLQLPMPEWHRFLSVPLAQPVALSAAIPMVLAILSGPVKLLRRFAAGLAVGFSGYLVTKAITGASVALIPPAYMLYWFVGNALAALLLARLTIPPRASKKK